MTTYNLLNAGFSPEEIKVRRNLKLNTIYDHIVEISLFDKAFNIDDYVSESVINEIKMAVSNTDSYKLKDIKEKVSDEISFFQIRLVLTRIS
nr:helix-turn-helix domain-containing protein [Virgibacillus sp. MSJ-26]